MQDTIDKTQLPLSNPESRNITDLVNAIKPIPPLQNTDTTINPNNIGSVTPYKLAPIPDGSSISTGIIESSSTLNKQAQARAIEERNKQAEIDKIQKEQSGLESSLADILSEQGQIGRRTSEFQKEQDVLGKQKSYDEITSQIEAKDLALRRKIEAMEKNPQGMTADALQGEITRIKREGASELADLSIIQSARNRDLFTAQSFVNQKVELLTQDLKTRFDATKFFYDENKEDLNKEDQRKFEKAIREDEREYKEARESIKSLEESKLTYLTKANENGAPSSVLQAIQSATTPEQAAVAAQGYLYSTDVIPYGDGSALIDKATGRVIKTFPGKPIIDDSSAKSIQAQYEMEQKIPSLQDKINSIDELLNSKSYEKVVGTAKLGRLPIISKFTGEAQTAVGAIHQLIQKETIDTLLALKKQGGTLGALSDSERLLLQSAATKLGDWEIKDDKLNGVGRWNIDEDSFEKELKQLRTLAERAISNARGVSADNPLGYNVADFNTSTSDGLGLFNTTTPMTNF
jgi:HD superfamily phosphohydrolase YqeK